MLNMFRATLGKAIENSAEKYLAPLAKLDTEHFTIEDIASVLHCSLSAASLIVKSGVRQGEFVEHKTETETYYSYRRKPHEAK
jgi:copper oxidase (laccase) domain-containing protein